MESRQNEKDKGFKFYFSKSAMFLYALLFICLMAVTYLAFNNYF